MPADQYSSFQNVPSKGDAVIICSGQIASRHKHSFKPHSDSNTSHVLQEHLHQARLVFQPETGMRKRMKLAGQLLPGLISSVAGSKCKQVLHIPAHLVQALKVPIPSDTHQTHPYLYLYPYFYCYLCS